MKKQDLRDALIKCIINISELELNGYIMFDTKTGKGRIERPNYTERKKQLLEMLDEVTKEIEDEMP
jgi:hypothetical protein